MRLGVAIATLVMSTAVQGGVPLPPIRPPESPRLAVPLPVPRPGADGPSTLFTQQPPEPFGPPAPITQHASEPFGPPAPPAFFIETRDDEAACRRVLDGGTISGERRPAIVGPQGCGIALPLMLRAVVMPNGRHVAIEPPAVIRCDLAERIADWLRDDLAGLASQAGDLVALLDASGYACRSRNHVAGAQLSEHSRGNAIDILAFRFRSRIVGLNDADEAAFLGGVDRTACARFSTVLGPGSDVYHENNLHLDLENRKNTSHYCHWSRH